MPRDPSPPGIAAPRIATGVHGAMTRMLVARSINLVGMAVGMALLGRLLDPAAFGQFAILAAIHVAAQSVGAFGLPAYLIRSPDLARETVAAAVGLSLALSGILCLAGLAAAVAMAGPGASGEVASALVPLSLSLLTGPAAMASEVRLQRALDFELVARAEVARMAVDVAVAVALAGLGFGVVALAWGLFAGRAAAAAALIALGGAEGRVAPGRRGWRALGGFGGRVTAMQLLPHLGEIAGTAAITAGLGAATMGLVNRAMTIRRIVDRTLFEGILPVILPAMSAALAGGAAPRTIWRRQVDYLAAVCWPAFACIAVLAEPLVLVLLGPGWDAAVPGVRILALTGVALPLTKMSQKLFVATGMEARFLRITAWTEVVRLALVAGAATLSFQAVCVALVLGMFVKAAAILTGLRGGLGARPADLLRPAARGLGLTAAALAGPLAVLWAGPGGGAGLLVAIPAAGLGWLVALRAMAHPLAAELRIALAGLRGRRA